MISQQTILRIKDIAISEIIMPYVALKNNSGCCPFHNEKTPSFHVKDNKGIFKCFGCGASGDGIRFVEMHEKLSFSETIERIARDHGITIKYEDSYTPEERKEKQDKQDTFRRILNYAQEYFQKQLQQHPKAKQYLFDRCIDDEIIEEWQLGYAPEDWKGITPGLIERGWYDPALHLGLIGSNDGRNYDTYRNRITIPLTDRLGQIIGFAGRIIGEGMPKYINPKESDLYKKSNVWFGWDKAIKQIAEQRNVFIVEGYFDVISMQRHDVYNTIASCGTAIDQKQWKQLKQYTPTVTLMYDGDKAGRDKLYKHTHSALKQGFHVQIVDMKDGEDPDQMARNYMAEA